MYNWTFLYFILGIGLAVLFGLWTRTIAARKARAPLPWFLLGFLLPVLGVIIAYLVPTVHRYGETIVDTRHTPIDRRHVREPEVEFARCPHCGASCPVNADHCGICGERLSA